MKTREAISAGQGILWVAATPIGNLGDASPRLRQLLAEADILLAEDTRTLRKLLTALDIKALSQHQQEVHRLDAEKESQLSPRVLDWLRAGKQVLLTVDAGTPGVSDPGARLVTQVRKAKLACYAVPGPSSLVAFLSVAGEHSMPLLFHGFFPRKAGDLPKNLGPGFHVWFESPQRIEKTLRLLENTYGECRIMLAKELSKKFEAFWQGKPQELLQHLVGNELRGEWVLGLDIDAGKGANPEETDLRIWQATLKSMMANGFSPSLAAREVSQIFGVPRNRVYSQAMELQKEFSSKI